MQLLVIKIEFTSNYKGCFCLLDDMANKSSRTFLLICQVFFENFSFFLIFCKKEKSPIHLYETVFLNLMTLGTETLPYKIERSGTGAGVPPTILAKPILHMPQAYFIAKLLHLRIAQTSLCESFFHANRPLIGKEITINQGTPHEFLSHTTNKRKREGTYLTELVRFSFRTSNARPYE